MTRLFAHGFGLVVFLTTAMAANAANELPQGSEDDSFEIEPPLLIPNRDAEKSPASDDVAASPVAIDLEKLEKDVERAKRAAAGAEHLFKIGVLAKLDVEKRALRVVRLESDLQVARLAEARETAIDQERKFAAGEITKAKLIEAEEALEIATEAAKNALAERERAELAAAEVNLQRQQKLMALGSGRKSEVARAAQKLAELRSPKNN